jgi:hypothetical protein
VALTHGAPLTPILWPQELESDVARTRAAGGGGGSAKQLAASTQALRDVQAQVAEQKRMNAQQAELLAASEGSVARLKEQLRAAEGQLSAAATARAAQEKAAAERAAQAGAAAVAAAQAAGERR